MNQLAFRPRHDGHALVPRAVRHAAAFSVFISGPTVVTFRARVRNVSTSGMLIDTPASVQVGDVLTASFPGRGDVMCAVVRSRAGTAGIRFIQTSEEAA